MLVQKQEEFYVGRGEKLINPVRETLKTASIRWPQIQTPICQLSVAIYSSTSPVSTLRGRRQLASCPSPDPPPIMARKPCHASR